MVFRIGNFFPGVALTSKNRKATIEQYREKNEGNLTIIYGEGRFINHVAYGFLDNISICGWKMHGTSTSKISTLFGVMCPVCSNMAIQAYQETLTDKLNQIDEGEISSVEKNEISDELRKAVKTKRGMKKILF